MKYDYIKGEHFFKVHREKLNIELYEYFDIYLHLDTKFEKLKNSTKENETLTDDMSKFSAMHSLKDFYYHEAKRKHMFTSVEDIRYLSSFVDIYGYIYEALEFIIKNGCRSRTELFNIVKDEMYDRCLKLYGCEFKTFESIFYSVWKENANGRLMDYFYKKRKDYFLNNDKAFWSLLILLVLLPNFYYTSAIPFVITITSVFFSVLFCADRGRYMLLPLVAFVLISVLLVLFIYSSDSYNPETILVVKDTIRSGLILFLFYPILIVNRSRLKDEDA